MKPFLLVFSIFFLNHTHQWIFLQQARAHNEWTNSNQSNCLVEKRTDNVYSSIHKSQKVSVTNAERVTTSLIKTTKILNHAFLSISREWCEPASCGHFKCTMHAEPSLFKYNYMYSTIAFFSRHFHFTLNKTSKELKFKTLQYSFHDLVQLFMYRLHKDQIIWWDFW